MRASITDPRDRLRKIDRYGVRPKILEEWIWDHQLSQAEERIFWLLWDLACRLGSYVLTVPVRDIALRARVTESTAHRALHQLTAKYGLLRRTRRMRPEGNRFREPIALTEVLLPAEVEHKLDFLKPRKSPAAAVVAPVQAAGTPQPATTEEGPILKSVAVCIPPFMMKLSLSGRISDTECDTWLAWKRGETAIFELSPNSRLTPEERERVLTAAPIMSQPEPRPAAAPTSAPAESGALRRPLRLDLFSAERLRQRISQVVPVELVGVRFREVAWSIEHGSLGRKQSLLHAINLGVKLLRDGVWTCPRKMPAAWQYRCELRD